jgi:hypothetical protein
MEERAVGAGEVRGWRRRSRRGPWLLERFADGGAPFVAEAPSQVRQRRRPGPYFGNPHPIIRGFGVERFLLVFESCHRLV